MLQRHVNQHFSKTDAKSVDKVVESNHSQSESSKNLKKAGVKLKKRPVVFSARIFDVFDAGIMAGIKHGVYNLGTRGKDLFNLDGDSIKFKSKIMGLKRDPGDGRRSALVKWVPENL